MDVEGGGFDEGQGAKNVSDEVDASNLVSTCMCNFELLISRRM